MTRVLTFSERREPSPEAVERAKRVMRLVRIATETRVRKHMERGR